MVQCHENPHTHMHIKTLFAGILLAFVAVSGALAAPPPSVNGLQGEVLENGNIVIRWNAPLSGDIAAYRLYYSAKSILANNGIYDDFAETDGEQTEFLFLSAPSEPEFYVAILAVNADGEESPYFTEEISVVVGEEEGTEAPSLLPVVSNPDADPTVEEMEEEPTSAGIVELLKAEAVSNTGVLLTFSAPINIASEDVADAVVITRAGTGVLAITRLTLSGTGMLIETELQEPEAVYRIELSEPLAGMYGEILDPVARSAFFTGYMPEEPIEEEDVYSDVYEVRNIRFTSQLMESGLYQLFIEWDENHLEQAPAGYLVSQSRDRGATLSEPYPVPADASRFDITGVPPGEFGVLIQVVDAYGRSSEGAFATTMIPVTSQMPTPTERPPVGSIIDVPTIPEHTPTDLPDSGATPLLLTLMLVGALLGWRHASKLQSFLPHRIARI